MIVSSHDDELFEKTVELLKHLDLTLQDYDDFCNKMNQTMSLGLKRSEKHLSSIKMFPTYVSKIPNGKETGCYLALDLGGTNYRVLVVTFGGKGVPPIINERTYSIPTKKMTGSGAMLFEYIAETLANFLETHGLKDNHYKLGFTFSFPCEQKGLSHALLVKWTKGFAASGIEGNNVAEILQTAMDKVGIHVTCVAVVNDTVGTLASCALVDAKCAVGLIAGTGTNAAYIESRDLVEFAEGECGSQVVINTEWGAFGDLGEIDRWRTKFDKMVDADSLYPGNQLFEKMVSGMYLGELVRHILVYLIGENLLFSGEVPESLQTKDKFLTKYLTDVERDPSHVFFSTYYMLTGDLGVPIVEQIDVKIVRYACELVSKRAAYLAGSGVACILRRLGRIEVTVGVDGSLYKFHPKFGERMTDMIHKLRPQFTRFCLRLSEDGSGKGAAAIAAAACRE